MMMKIVSPFLSKRHAFYKAFHFCMHSITYFAITQKMTMIFCMHIQTFVVCLELFAVFEDKTSEKNKSDQ